MSIWNQYKAPNIGLLFYKQIYKEAPVREKIKLDVTELTIDVPKEGKTPSPFDGFYTDLYQKSIGKYKQIENPASSPAERFSLFTTYPGLLVGSGYPHDTKAKGDFKIGFYFDHTSGQPVIPGSSVKGILNSVFELDINAKGKNYTAEKSVGFVKWLLTEVDETTIATSLNAKTLKQLQQEIFGDEDKPGNDVFFDAVINNEKTGDKPFLANDFITHHENPLKNPNPIQFLKVLPGVGFEFRFKLSDKTTWKSDLKIKLFNKILLTLGIGAKTNVGYGQFITEQEHKLYLEDLKKAAVTNVQQTRKMYEKQTASPGRTFNTRTSDEKRYEPKTQIERLEEQIKNNDNLNKTTVKLIEEQPNWADPSAVKIGSKVNATILSWNNGLAKIQLQIKQFGIVKTKNIAKPDSDVIEVEVSNVLGNLSKGKFDVDIKK